MKTKDNNTEFNKLFKKEIKWLIKNQKYLSISAIGEELGIKDQLLKTVNGSRILLWIHREKTTKFINNLRKL